MKADLDRATSKLPHPTWVIDLAPILPQLKTVTPLSGSSPTQVTTATAGSQLQSALAGAPANVRPPAGGSWTDISAGLTAKWIEDQFRGKQLAVTGKMTSGGVVRSGEVRVLGEELGFTAGDVSVHELKFEATLLPTQNAAAAALQPGDSLNVSGYVLMIEAHPARDLPSAIDMTIKLQRSELVK